MEHVSDIVVNDLILRNTSFKLPDGAIIDNKFQDKSVEYIYEILLKSKKYKFDLMINDILQPTNDSEQNKGDTKEMTQNNYLERKLMRLNLWKRWRFLKTHQSIILVMEKVLCLQALNKKFQQS